MFLLSILFCHYCYHNHAGGEFLSPRQVKAFSGVLFFVALALMILILLKGGQEAKGARRWLSLFGFALQPSEFIKPSLAVLFANLFVLGKKQQQAIFYGLAAFILLVVAGLLLSQPDIGMTMLVCSTFLIILFFAGTPFRSYFRCSFAALVLVVVVYYVFPHVQDRILHVNDYQVKKSLAAFANGGFLVWVWVMGLLN